MKEQEYSLYINGKELDICLLQLEALDDSPQGSVSILATEESINITRKTKKDYASVDIKASGYLPFNITIKWSQFKRLILKKHADQIKISIKGKAKIFVDGMYLTIESISEQLNLPLGDGQPALTVLTKKISQDAKNIIKRIRQIDDENKKAGIISGSKLFNVYERDQTLSSLIKRLRGEKCQICGYYFEMSNGGRYVECHHLEALSNNGLDCSNNILVLCANHHRQFHFGYVEIIEHTIDFIKIKLDNQIYICNFGPQHDNTQ